MQLLPRPKSVELKDGSFNLTLNTVINYMPSCRFEALKSCGTMLDMIEELAGRRPTFTRVSDKVAGAVNLTITDNGAAEGYSIVVDTDSIDLSGNDAAGLFYAVQTFCQMLMSVGRSIPCCVIEDEPDFKARGFYHDVTRGKVPKLETLFALVDKMAFYKMNQLQLYVEHTFAFAKHADLWAGADPLTAEEIIRLDEYCRSRHVELVPSLSTFGHMYTMLCSKRKEHLNELDVKASELPFSFHNRMAHYTLDCSNQESIELVTDIINEFAPLFSSRMFNICCDETFDLGKGKNAEKAAEVGSSRLYLDFLKKVMEATRNAGKIPQFWGDIILKDPALLKELPEDVIALNWDYSAELISHSDSRALSDAGVRFYNCPGVSGWNNLINNVENASRNIVNFTREGKEFGAEGILNTDWGDYGHINMLVSSYHGMLLGAAVSWNYENNSDIAEFDCLFDFFEFGDDNAGVAALLRNVTAVNKINWFAISRWCDAAFADEACPIAAFEKLTEDLTTEVFAESAVVLEKLYGELLDIVAGTLPADPLAGREILCGLNATLIFHRLAVAVKMKAAGIDPEGDFACHAVADELIRFERDLSELWHARNKPSEFYRLKQTILKLASKMDSIA